MKGARAIASSGPSALELVIPRAGRQPRLEGRPGLPQDPDWLARLLWIRGAPAEPEEPEPEAVTRGDDDRQHLLLLPGFFLPGIGADVAGQHGFDHLARADSGQQPLGNRLPRELREGLAEPG